MRAYLPSYEMRAGKTLGETLDLMAREPGVWKPFAGGTDLMVVFETGKLAHRKFVSIWGIKELRGIEATSDTLTLGALTTYAEIQRDQVIAAEFPMLCQAANETGAIAIQNRGTIGGNIVNASPAADSPPALLVYEAELELTSARGSRWLPYREFHTGYKKIALKPDELVSRVRIPRATQGWNHFYRKVGTRKAQAISKVCFAGMAQVRNGNLGEVRIALGSVAATPIRCAKTEVFLRGKSLNDATIRAARAEIEREIVPIDDIRSTREFRLTVTANVLEQFLCGIGSAN